MIKKLDIIDKIIEEKKNKKPDLYKLILLNDDFTTMDFVVKILIMFLNKRSTEAQSLMLKVHNEGSAVCGLFPIDVAKTIQK
ncbi:MAG: ATP-dependent Clp protease adaptor ClpS, partial [Pelagibacteraceae bacterium]